MSAANDDKQAELMETKRALMATRGELLKSQVVAATRSDVIRMLGYISNRQEIPDLSFMLPCEPNVRAVYACELRELATHLRERASRFEAIAATLDAVQ